MVDEHKTITIINFVVMNDGERSLTITDVGESPVVIPPHTKHTFDSTGAYLGRIDGKIAFELAFREGSLVIHKGKAFGDGGQILIAATLT